MAWILTEKGMYCLAIVVIDTKDSLYECKIYCETNGAKQLTYYATGTTNCLCCTIFSELVQSRDHEAKVYTLVKGK